MQGERSGGRAVRTSVPVRQRTGARAPRTRPGDFVTTEDGTGIVHLAPYGEDDIIMLRRDDLPVTQMIDPSGRVVPEGGEFAGLWIKDADPKIVEDLDERGLLFKAEDYLHAYPHCWRCHTPLLYYPRKDWYIRTSRIRDQLHGIQRGDQLAAADDQVRTLRRLAGEQRRLVAVARPLLGDAAADLAMQRRPRHLHRLLRGARPARRSGT